MPYITVSMTPVRYQITLDDILSGNVDMSRMVNPNTNNTRTTFRSRFDSKFLSQFDFDNMLSKILLFNERHKTLFEAERPELYHTFFVPKKSGGLRRIDEPLPELKNALYELKDILEKDLLALYHTAAFAYVKGRCTVDAIKRHQANESKWFAKLDFTDFFGSTTEDFVYNMFSEIFPFCEIVRTNVGANALRKALSLCFLNGGLPQGTPTSPLITNVMMIPIDHQIANDLRKADEHYVYTRYADDLTISSRVNFSIDALQNYIIEVCQRFNAPFSLNRKKTRYGSSSGRNWNLGLMLNKDNQITIGHKNARNFKAMCNNYINDKLKGVNWDLHSVQNFQGIISYYRSIEREYIDYIIRHYNQKYKVDIMTMIKADLK